MSAHDTFDYNLFFLIKAIARLPIIVCHPSRIMTGKRRGAEI